MIPRLSLYGRPMPLPPTSPFLEGSFRSIAIVEPTLGFHREQPSMDLPPGATPYSDNFIMREGALEPRPMLALSSSTPNPMQVAVTGLFNSVDVNGNNFPLLSGTTRVAFLSSTSWSVASYVSAGGMNDAPSASTISYWDMAQVYAPDPDQNVVVMANGSNQSLYCWASGTTVFSTLTEAPPARYITAFDNYLIAFNIIDPSGAHFVQRVQWSDRGNPFSWTPASGSLAGNEDLLAMNGAGTRIMANENRLILFSTEEIWQGFEGTFPSVFQFQPLDRTTGCPFPWTAVMTQDGIYFLSSDYRVYKLDKSGGPSVVVSEPVHKSIRDAIAYPERSWSVYDPLTNHYCLFYPVTGGSGTPQQALYLNLSTGAWAPQSFDPVSGGLSLTRGAQGFTPSSAATIWSQTSTAGITWAQAQGSWSGQLAQQVSATNLLYVGSSSGTAYVMASTYTSDAGTPVTCYWRSGSLGGGQPQWQKTVRELRIDYQTDSASSLTLQMSTNQGTTFDAGVAQTLPAQSGESQAIFYPYVAGRYPSFKVSQTGTRARLYRFWVELVGQGR